MKKRIVMIAVTAMACLSVAGCGGKKADSASQSASGTQAVAEAQTETLAQPQAETLEVPEADEQPAPEAVADELKEAQAGSEGSADGQAADQSGEATEETQTEETQTEGEPAAEAEGQQSADASATAETAQSVEESRVPSQIRDLLVGEWQDMTSQRAGMEITEGEEAGGKDFHAQIFWSGSYKDRMVWDMDLTYDPDSHELTYKRGRKAEVTYGDDGMVANEEVKWEDAEGAFTFEGGEIRWKDSKQEDAGDFVFVRVYAYDITAEEFSENLFRVLAGMESGTAGSSLKQAQAAHEILLFTANRQIWNVDAIARRSAITEAWEALTDEEKSLVKKNFDGIAGLIDKAYKDYESVRGTFEDAGVGDDMKALSVNVYAKRSWNALRDLVTALK